VLLAYRIARVAAGSGAKHVMTCKPQQPLPRWDIYRAAAKAIGTVKAANVDAAIKKAAQEFDVQDIKKLITVRYLGRRSWPVCAV